MARATVPRRYIAFERPRLHSGNTTGDARRTARCGGTIFGIRPDRQLVSISRVPRGCAGRHPLLCALHTLLPSRFTPGRPADTWSLPDIWSPARSPRWSHHPPGITSSAINLINCPHGPVKTAWLQQFRNWLPSDRRLDARFCLHSPSIISRDGRRSPLRSIEFRRREKCAVKKTAKKVASRRTANCRRSAVAYANRLRRIDGAVASSRFGVHEFCTHPVYRANTFRRAVAHGIDIWLFSLLNG